MIIIGSNLEQLSKQHKICEKSLIDEFSLSIQLGDHFYGVNRENISKPIIYGSTLNLDEMFTEKNVINQNLKLEPNCKIITCSKHQYNIPLDYFGLVQTKGTLARLFVQATCNDGQIEPGFNGHITLEIVNFSPWTIEIPVGSDVAQLYLIKCSSPAESGYNGRYAFDSKSGPTLPRFK